MSNDSDHRAAIDAIINAQGRLLGRDERDLLKSGIDDENVPASGRPTAGLSKPRFADEDPVLGASIPAEGFRHLPANMNYSARSIEAIRPAYDHAATKVNSPTEPVSDARRSIERSRSPRATTIVKGSFGMASAGAHAVANTAAYDSVRESPRATTRREGSFGAGGTVAHAVANTAAFSSVKEFPKATTRREASFGAAGIGAHAVANTAAFGSVKECLPVNFSRSAVGSRSGVIIDNTGVRQQWQVTPDFKHAVATMQIPVNPLSNRLPPTEPIGEDLCRIPNSRLIRFKRGDTIVMPARPDTTGSVGVPHTDQPTIPSSTGPLGDRGDDTFKAVFLGATVAAYSIVGGSAIGFLLYYIKEQRRRRKQKQHQSVTGVSPPTLDLLSSPSRHDLGPSRHTSDLYRSVANARSGTSAIDTAVTRAADPVRVKFWAYEQAE